MLAEDHRDMVLQVAGRRVTAWISASTAVCTSPVRAGALLVARDGYFRRPSVTTRRRPGSGRRRMQAGLLAPLPTSGFRLCAATW
ncbi:hypothetical protein [Sorangium sp. So ce1335]|uniref:hypothetical protein n=1 Tax=Sorangium sp. So ce1335 TaxID=3133335 RepID=UPI003F5EDFDC